VVLLRTEVSEESSASIIGVTRIGEIGSLLAVTSKQYQFLRSLLLLLVTTNVVPSSPILVILTMEVIRSSETSVFTRTTRDNILEYSSLHSHDRNNLKSYTSEIIFWFFYKLRHSPNSGTSVTNQYWIHEEIKSRLNSCNAFHHSA
jgi:hypothetical protein